MEDTMWETKMVKLKAPQNYQLRFHPVFNKAYNNYLFSAPFLNFNIEINYRYQAPIKHNFWLYRNTHVTELYKGRLTKWGKSNTSSVSWGITSEKKLIRI